MNQNPGFSQQQQPYANQQYTPLPHQQVSGAPQPGYSQASPQTQQGNAYAQHGAPLPNGPGLMQPPTQQGPSNMQLQQQPSYQIYQQGTFAPTPTPAPLSEPWSQNPPNAQWQNATNSTSTTATTTTTTKTTKEKQSSQPNHGASYATSDFSSLMQQTPQSQQMQQQPLQQAPQQQSWQQQQTVDYSQLIQPQPQPQQATNYSQLLQNAPPQTRQTVDFSQLVQTAPPPQPQTSQGPPTIHAPPVIALPPMMHAPPVVPPPPKPAKANKKQASTAVAKTTTTTTKKKTSKTVVGGLSRQRAAEKSNSELRRFDHEVSERLKNSHMVICPENYDYYATNQGYLCGGGSHFFSHDEVEAMMTHGREPRMERVNKPYLGGRPITPPPRNGDGSGDEPAFWSAERQIAIGMEPITLLRDKKNKRSNPFGGGSGPFG